MHKIYPSEPILLVVIQFFRLIIMLSSSLSYSRVHIKCNKNNTTAKEINKNVREISDGSFFQEQPPVGLHSFIYLAGGKL